MNPELIFWSAVFAFTLFALIKFADWFIEFSEKMGLALGVPQLVIGVTVVALGTSLPELASSIAAIYEGKSEIVLSNVMGSNITNVFLILGALCIIGRGKVLESQPPIHDTLFLFGSAAFLCWAIWDSQFQLWEGIVCAAGLVLYLIACLRETLRNKGNEENPPMRWYYLPLVILSGVGIYFCANYNIESIIKISEIISVGAEVISATAVALGTSLPELLVSITAVRKGKVALALGNVLGSNIFNAFGVSGVSRFFGDLVVADLNLSFLLPMMIAATFALFLFYSSKKLAVWKGLILLAVYAFFVCRIVQINL